MGALIYGGAGGVTINADDSILRAVQTVSTTALFNGTTHFIRCPTEDKGQPRLVTLIVSTGVSIVYVYDSAEMPDFNEQFANEFQNSLVDFGGITIPTPEEIAEALS